MIDWHATTYRRGMEATARVGHLYLLIRSYDPDPTVYEWFVMLDDEDKCYERALAAGTAPDEASARADARAAVERSVAAIIADHA